MTAKVPVRQFALPAQVRIVKVLPFAGVKPPMSETLRMPPSVAGRFVGPAIWSYWVPAVSPPISTL